MNEAANLLIRLLAYQDAIFLPARKKDWARLQTTAVLTEARADYFKTGMLWKSHGINSVERTQHQQLLEEIERRKLIHREGKTRKTRLRLTHKGDMYARSLCCIPNADAGHSSLVRLEALQILLQQERYPNNAGDELRDRGLVCELRFTDFPAYDRSQELTDELVIVQAMMMPAIVRGWVESDSSQEGHVAFWPTKAGLKAASEPEPEIPDNFPEELEGAFRLYDDTTYDRRDELRAANPNDMNEIGVCGLPLGGRWHGRQPQFQPEATS